MLRLTPIVLSLVVLAGSGYLSGVKSGRWATSRVIEEAVSQLALVPIQVDQWEGEDQKLNERMLRIADISGYVARRYVNRVDGRQVSILLVCGRSGPISVHTPDVCYGGIGYELSAAPEKVSGPSKAAQDEFWKADFRKSSGAVSDGLQIHWAWRVSDHWVASANPRVSFAAAPILYKLYVVDEGNASNAAASTDFLRAILPVLDTTLFNVLQTI